MISIVSCPHLFKTRRCLSFKNKRTLCLNLSIRSLKTRTFSFQAQLKWCHTIHRDCNISSHWCKSSITKRSQNTHSQIRNIRWQRRKTLEHPEFHKPHPLLPDYKKRIHSIPILVMAPSSSIQMHQSLETLMVCILISRFLKSRIILSNCRRKLNKFIRTQSRSILDLNLRHLNSLGVWVEFQKLTNHLCNK